MVQAVRLTERDSCVGEAVPVSQVSLLQQYRATGYPSGLLKQSKVFLKEKIVFKIEIISSFRHF